jgi:tetratricopeptide (TPR) repeat protein
LDYLPGRAEIAESMGDFYNHQNYFKESMDSYRQSQQMFGQLDMPAGIARLLIKQGNLFMKNQFPDQAIARYEEGLNIAKNVNIPAIKMEAWQNLSDIYFSMGDLEQAFLSYKNYREVKDQLFTLETGRYLAEIEARYEMEKNRQELLLLQRERELMQIKETRARLIIIIMVAFIVIMLLWILLYLRHSNLKNGHEKITLQLKMFRSQLNPHFIFNSLGSIQSSIINEEPDKAVKYISRFSRLMRNILDSSDNERIPLSREIATMENYLELQKVRFTHKFDYHLSVEDHLDAESILIPPMLAQPFIENAIEHGIKPMETKGLITINIQHRNDSITIQIEDNGIGRKKAGELLRKQDKDHKSMAIDITRQRIEVINRKSKNPIRFEIEDLCHQNGDARGTRVVFEVPV